MLEIEWQGQEKVLELLLKFKNWHAIGIDLKLSFLLNALSIQNGLFNRFNCPKD